MKQKDSFERGTFKERRENIRKKWRESEKDFLDNDHKAAIQAQKIFKLEYEIPALKEKLDKSMEELKKAKIALDKFGYFMKLASRNIEEFRIRYQEIEKKR